MEIDREEKIRIGMAMIKQGCSEAMGADICLFCPMGRYCDILIREAIKFDGDFDLYTPNNWEVKE